jgi:hypothetical protein
VCWGADFIVANLHSHRHRSKSVALTWRLGSGELAILLAYWPRHSPTKGTNVAKRVMDPGAAWLALNDPQYVSPATKAAQTRAIPVDPAALASYMDRPTGTVKRGGRYTQAPVLGFEGGSEDEAGQVVPVVEATQERTIDQVRQEQTYGGVRRRGKRGGRQARKARQ